MDHFRTGLFRPIQLEARQGSAHTTMLKLAQSKRFRPTYVLTLAALAAVLTATHGIGAAATSATAIGLWTGGSSSDGSSSDGSIASAAIDAVPAPYGLATIAGRVVDADGRPLSGVTVELRGGGEGSARFAFVDGHRNSRPTGLLVTDSTGEFELHFVPHPHRPYALALEAEGFAAPSWNWRAIGAADVFDLGTVALPKAATVRGQVVDGQGRPLAGPWRVTVASAWSLPVAGPRAHAGPTWVREWVDPETGRFEIVGLPPGKADIRLDAEGLPFFDGPMVNVPAGGALELDFEYTGPIPPSE
ncbi:carboxypeptidase-like regulatory domain-containing protein [Engelhardtia mirabilis]|uniref:Nickel uptake substrate-specific transmembrane region n=1 Tax=Engelhardtia mirabilis TaxID=2528011 RepID=A0A518BDD2_9BACT|nr:hypothetical protein Pla133_00460 [Planctomycetes bacterium Pla133]QDU99310.1 hypothetical protein Pla86_00460 [Planctomycetes bacterium Pla86]